MPDIRNAQHVHGVASPEQWRQRALEFGARAGFFDELVERDLETDAIINAGRWVAVCPWCNNAPSVEPAWQLAICHECGSVYAPRVPDNYAEIEAALAARPIPARNWAPGESVVDLETENQMYGGA